MLQGFRLTMVSIICIALALGCAGRAVKRAPIDSVPAGLEPDLRIEMLEEMTEEHPDDANLFFEIGNLYYDEAMPSEAKCSYEKALAIDPKMNSARVNLAMLLAESGEIDSAKVLLEEAIAVDPKDAKAYNNLGTIHYTEKDIDRAVKYYTKGIELEPTNVEARYNLGLAFAESGLLLEAIREWRAVLEIEEESETAQRARLSLDRVERTLKK